MAEFYRYGDLIFHTLRGANSSDLVGSTAALFAKPVIGNSSRYSPSTLLTLGAACRERRPSASQRCPEPRASYKCDYTATGAPARSTLPRPQFYGVKLPPDLVAQAMHSGSLCSASNGPSIGAGIIVDNRVISLWSVP